MCRDYDTAAALIDRGLLINQNLATGWQLRAHVSLWLGQHEGAIKQIARASRLDPKYPEIFRAETVMAAAFLCQGEYDEAATWAAKALVRLPYFANALLLSAAANALAGNIVEARKIMVRFRESNPAASISRFRKDTAFSRPEDVERMIAGLRLAGLTE